MALVSARARRQHWRLRWRGRHPDCGGVVLSAKAAAAVAAAAVAAAAVAVTRKQCQRMLVACAASFELTAGQQCVLMV